MIKKILVLLLCSSTLLAQNNEQAAVIAPIQQLFDAMLKKDSSMLRATLYPNARLATTFTDKEGKPQLRVQDIERFVGSVANAKQKFEEKIWSYEVQVDGNLATAWTEYSFYLDDKLSHCGVNAFELFQTEEGWKITSIVDTRRRNDCIEKPEIALDTFMNAWHKAAATADEDIFFGSMTEDAIYLGTDPSERWLRDELKEWSKEYFERDNAWDFTPKERHWMLSADRKWLGLMNC